MVLGTSTPKKGSGAVTTTRAFCCFNAHRSLTKWAAYSAWRSSGVASGPLPKCVLNRLSAILPAPMS